MTCGIYRILNTLNGKYYIGASINIENRFHKHIRLLNTGKHDNKYLQKDWDEHNQENFQFSIIERCSESSVYERENDLILTAKELGESLYNISLEIWNYKVVDNNGESNGMSKLKAEQVIEIKRRLASGENATKVCIDYGVTDDAICHIRKLRSWKNVAEEYNEEMLKNTGHVFGKRSGRWKDGRSTELRDNCLNETTL